MIHAVLAVLAAAMPVAAQGGGDALAPITKVEIGANREFRVNGKPFFPIMSWLQEPSRYPKLRAVGINAFCGNHQVSAVKCLEAAKAAGGYGVYAFEAGAAGNGNLLAWIHGDEPDLPRTVYDAKVTAGKAMAVNGSTPLEKIIDGVTHSWSVLDPMVGAEVSLELKAPVTIRSLAVWQTISPGLAVAKDVVFLGDGKEILKATLKAEKGRQKLDLPAAATLRVLTLRVVTAEAGKNAWGSISEIEGLDESGTNVLLSPPRTVPQQSPEALAAAFAKIKAADASRPVLVTFTSYFMTEFTQYDPAERKRMYPELVKSCDAVGFDVYPIYGWNQPEWLVRVADGVTQLGAIAGEKRPVYAWIETSKGGQYIDYAQQKDVLPKHTRAEVWMAIIRGATAIGYFTHVWKPSFSEFGPTEEMQRELARLNGQITRLAPAILAAPAKAKVTIELPDSAACHVKATAHDGSVYVLAQNIDMKLRPGKATIRVEGLKGGATIEVVDESRTLTAPAAGGQFTDELPALAEHIYRIAGLE